jgi:hypothetical protein
MPKAPVAETVRRAETLSLQPKYGGNLPQNSVQRIGLPALKGPRLKFKEFIEYWNEITPALRAHISVYVFALFPKLNFPDREHNIGVIPGETPFENEEDILNRFGLGDFYFKMKYSAEGLDKVITSAWLTGFSDGLPGFTDWTNHPPLFIRDAKYALLDDDKNIKGGFIQWLRKTGQIQGETGADTKETETMAEVKASETLAGAMGQIMGKVVDKAFEEKETPAPVVTAPQTNHGTEMMREAFSTSLEIAKQTNVDVPKLLETAAHLMQREPIDYKPFTDQVMQARQESADLMKLLLHAEGKRAEDLAAQLQRQNDLMQRVLEREREPRAPIERADPLESIISTADKFDRLKTALGFTPPVPDEDAPRRRKRNDDDDDEEKKKGIGEMILENLPGIMTTLTTLGTLVVTGMHNARVMSTGEGQTIAPPAPQTGLLPFQAPPFPGPNPNPQHQMHAPPAQQQPQTMPQVDPMAMQQQRAFAFAQQITPGLLGSFERNETGYDYAELFIKAYGRSGEFGYENIKTSGQQSPDAPFNPLDNARALAQFLAMYPPIWTKIGNDKRSGDFLLQFVSYDEFLREQDVPNLMRLCIEYEVESVAEFLALPEDEDDDSPDNGPSGADIRDATGAIPMPGTDGAVPEVVTAPDAGGKQLRKSRAKIVN